MLTELSFVVTSTKYTPLVNSARSMVSVFLVGTMVLIIFPSIDLSSIFLISNDYVISTLSLAGFGEIINDTICWFALIPKVLLYSIT